MTENCLNPLPPVRRLSFGRFNHLQGGQVCPRAPLSLPDSGFCDAECCTGPTARPARPARLPDAAVNIHAGALAAEMLVVGSFTAEEAHWSHDLPHFRTKQNHNKNNN